MPDFHGIFIGTKSTNNSVLHCQRNGLRSFFYYTLQAGITLLRDELRYGHLISAMSEIDCSSQQSAISENGSPVVFFAGVV